MIKVMLSLAMLFIASSGYAAEVFPSRVVKIISPFPAGSPPDAMARIVSQKMSEILKQPFVVENKPGAYGELAIADLMKAKPDGYTLCHCRDGQLAIYIAARLEAGKKLTYVPQRDLAPIGLDAEVYFSLVANLDFPPNTLQEVAQFVKTNPGKVSIGAGTPSAFLIAGLLKAEGIDVVVVPYQTGSEPAAVRDLLGGHIQLATVSTTGAVPLITAGKVKLIGTVGKERNPFFPQARTLGEQGYRAFDEVPVSWGGLFAPRDTPSEVQAVLRDAMKHALGDPTVVEAFRRNGNVVRFMGPEETAARYDETWTLLKLLWKTNVKLLGD